MARGHAHVQFTADGEAVVNRFRDAQVLTTRYGITGGIARLRELNTRAANTDALSYENRLARIDADNPNDLDRLKRLLNDVLFALDFHQR